MTIWQAFLLGLIQGLTEFLPVSSSGHLALGQYFLGFEHIEKFILFDTVCHLGTLLAIFFFFFPAIKDSLTRKSNGFWMIMIGTLPLFPLALLIKPLKALFSNPQLLGPCFLISSGLLFASLSWRVSLRLAKNRLSLPDSFIIGIFQALAVLPGISRSGATISTACILGWKNSDAIQFSFLLAIPAIIGATLIEGWQIWQSPIISTEVIDPLSFVIGFFTSFLVGCVSLWTLIRVIIHDKWRYFAWYCLILGTLTTLYFNVFIAYGT